MHSCHYSASRIVGVDFTYFVCISLSMSVVLYCLVMHVKDGSLERHTKYGKQQTVLKPNPLRNSHVAVSVTGAISGLFALIIIHRVLSGHIYSLHFDQLL